MNKFLNISDFYNIYYFRCGLSVEPSRKHHLSNIRKLKCDLHEFGNEIVDPQGWE